MRHKKGSVRRTKNKQISINLFGTDINLKAALKGAAVTLFTSLIIWLAKLVWNMNNNITVMTTQIPMLQKQVDQLQSTLTDIELGKHKGSSLILNRDSN